MMTSEVSAGQQTVITWLKNAFKSEKFGEVKVEFPDLDTSGGYAADVVFATVRRIKNGSEETYDVIIKKGKDSVLQDPSSRVIANAYINEVNFYSKFLPYFQKFAEKKNVAPFQNAPHCYGTISEENQYVVILENLKKKGFTVHDMKIPIDINHVNLVIDAYAKWHALSFALKDQQPKIFENFAESNKMIFDDTILDNMGSSVDKELDSVINMYKTKNKPLITEKLEWMKGKSPHLVRDFMNNKNNDYLVIRHGDCWNNNFLFHYNEGNSTPDEVVVIDWQISILGSPVADLTQFLFYGCSRTELVHLDEILNRYYNSLSKTIRELESDPEKCYPKKIFLEQFKKYSVFPITGVPFMAKMSCKVETEEKCDVTDIIRDGNFRGLLGDELRDPEGFFNRIDGVLELCIERGLI